MTKETKPTPSVKRPQKANRKGGPRPGMTDAEREAEVLTMMRMRRAGSSYHSIAAYFNLSVFSVHDKVKRALQDMPKEEATELRALEAMKLDNAEMRLEAAINAGDVGAINALVRLSESRRRLLGLDMPEQHEVKISREEKDLAEQLVEAWREKLKRENG